MSTVTVLEWPVRNLEYFVDSQSLGAGGGSFALIQNKVPSFARTVTLYSVQDNSFRDYTITGKDELGNEVFETLTGPAAGATEETTQEFHEVTSVTGNGATLFLNVGIGTKGRSLWVYTPPSNTSLGFQADATATINWSVVGSTVFPQYFDKNGILKRRDMSDFEASISSDLENETTSTTSVVNVEGTINAWQLKINSSDTTGTMTLAQTQGD